MSTTELQAPATTGCCPRFDPAPWDGKEVNFQDRMFVHEHVHSLLHIPLDMQRKMEHATQLIEAAGAALPDRMVLSDEASAWGAELYVPASKDVPDASMAALPGTYLCKVFEGPYRDAPKWMEEMKRYLTERGKISHKTYLGYTTCPRCAKAYGKNYVVLLARVDA